MKRRNTGFYLRAAAAAVLAGFGLRELYAASIDHRILPALWRWLLPVLAAVILMRPERAWVRNACGTAVLLSSFRSMDQYFRSGGDAMLHGLAGALLCMAQLVTAAILFAPSLVHWAARPLTRLIDGVYFGSGGEEAPPITLRLAQAYRQAGRHEDAIAECERQLEWHPRSLELWREIIANARRTGSGEKAADYFRHATRRLGSEDRSALAREFPALFTQ